MLIGELSNPKMYVKCQKINMFRLDVWTFLSEIKSCFAFYNYIVLHCIRNQNTEFEIDSTILFF